MIYYEIDRSAVSQERHRAARGVEAARIGEVRRRIEPGSLRQQRRVGVAVGAGQWIPHGFELTGDAAQIEGSRARVAPQGIHPPGFQDAYGTTTTCRNGHEDRHGAENSSS